MVTSNVRLVAPLGAGGMGTVWVADHLGLDTQVAVKFISPVLAATDPSLVARFKREASAAAKLNSPHVVRMFDFGVMDEGTPYMVMELLSGNSLADWLDLEGTLSPRVTALIIAQAAKALSAAHKIGIVHRDIKPDNLFLIESEYEVFVKVLDFGVAKQQDTRDKAAVTQTGALMGTPVFMSPEQVLSAKGADHRSDLWALAVVAYYALTGYVPFDGETLGALHVAIASGRFTPVSRVRPDLPPALDGWFQRALAVDPAARFQTARELAKAFADAIGPSAGLTPEELAGASTDSAPSLDGLVETPPLDAESYAPTLHHPGRAAPIRLAATPSPTFAGASVTADPPKRTLPRGAVYAVVAAGLVAGSTIAIVLLQSGGDVTGGESTAPALAPEEPAGHEAIGEEPDTTEEPATAADTEKQPGADADASAGGAGPVATEPPPPPPPAAKPWRPPPRPAATRPPTATKPLATSPPPKPTSKPIKDRGF